MFISEGNAATAGRLGGQGSCKHGQLRRGLQQQHRHNQRDGAAEVRQQRDRGRYHRRRRGAIPVFHALHVDFRPGDIRKRAGVLRGVQEQSHADCYELVHNEFGAF